MVRGLLAGTVLSAAALFSCQTTSVPTASFYIGPEGKGTTAISTLIRDGKGIQSVSGKLDGEELFHFRGLFPDCRSLELKLQLYDIPDLYEFRLEPGVKHLTITTDGKNGRANRVVRFRVPHNYKAAILGISGELRHCQLDYSKVSIMG